MGFGKDFYVKNFKVILSIIGVIIFINLLIKRNKYNKYNKRLYEWEFKMKKSILVHNYLLLHHYLYLLHLQVLYHVQQNQEYQVENQVEKSKKTNIK